MPIHNRISAFHADMTEWRQYLHRHPEIAFEEFQTADFVASRLKEFGIEVHTGLATTGVVGVLHGQRGPAAITERRIALRADMDALPMQEETNLPYASGINGRMHGCGHDGHTVMLLGAARYLAETRNFDGTVIFIFQPAEENGGGARVMMDQGLFRQFPVQSVWAMHNSPSIPVGKIAVRAGASMAAVDDFEIIIHGKGGHAASPHETIDPIMVGMQLYNAFQMIISRNVDPVESAVLSVTCFHAGSANNVIAGSAQMVGTVRSFVPSIRAMMEQRLRETCQHIANMHGARIDVHFHKGYPPLINTRAETEFAGRIAAEIVGEENVLHDTPPVMGAEDFAFMLMEKPGSYIWVGQSDSEHRASVHHPQYDFNDRILPIGASYFARLVERTLAHGL